MLIQNQLFEKESSSFINSDVFINLTLPCFFNFLSSDQTGQLNFKARAKYSTSSESGDIFSASFKKSEKSSFLKNFIFGDNKNKNA